jgi:hypothetical protein
MDPVGYLIINKYENIFQTVWDPFLPAGRHVTSKIK